MNSERSISVHDVIILLINIILIVRFFDLFSIFFCMILFLFFGRCRFCGMLPLD